jgi:hypothetical protein
MLFPIAKHFRLLRGADFNYPFQYWDGTPDSATMVDLSDSTGVWTITWTANGGGTTIYSTDDFTTSGVYFGSPYGSPATNGFITFHITAADTQEIPWTIATYTFDISDDVSNERLLTGGIGIT